jgi:hypothetical protein
MEAGAAGGCGHGAAEAQFSQVQVTDECVYDTNQCLRRDVVVHTRRKEIDLTAICSLDEAHKHLAGFVLALGKL